MRVSAKYSSGRADPLGLLVLAVMLALSITIVIQVQSSNPSERGGSPSADCAYPWIANAAGPCR